MRLARAMALAGVASRRASEELILAGRVSVNGAVAASPALDVTPGRDRISVDGKPLSAAVLSAERLYFALNKPKGYLCSSEAGGERLVLDLFAPWLERWRERHARVGAAGADGSAAAAPRLFTVGRLDVATTGLIFVTSDGEWAQRVAHPSSGVSKEYIITAAEPPTKRQLALMLEGTQVDGAHVRPLRVEKVDAPDGGSRNRVLVEVQDGRHHEVRELAAAAGVLVDRLKRTRVGSFRMPSDLQAGSFVQLTARQAAMVLQAPRREPSRARAPPWPARPPATPMMTKLRGGAQEEGYGGGEAGGAAPGGGSASSASWEGQRLSRPFRGAVVVRRTVRAPDAESGAQPEEGAEAPAAGGANRPPRPRRFGGRGGGRGGGRSERGGDR